MLERAEKRLRPLPRPSALDGLELQWERFEDVIEEALPLLKRHYAELELDEPFDPDWRSLFFMANNDRLRILTVREGKRLVGYAGGLKMNYLASQNTRVIAINALYLEETYRGSLRLIRQMLTPFYLWAREIKALRVEQQVQGKHQRRINAMLKHMGWQPAQDETWVLRV